MRHSSPVGPQGKSAMEGSWTLQKVKWEGGEAGSLEALELTDPA